jgi:hypothetical protein
VLFIPWQDGIHRFPPRDHELGYGNVKERFASVEIDITFKNRMKGRRFGLETDQVQGTPRLHTSI